MVMKWNNLQRNKCPQCGKDLYDALVDNMFKCPCGFVISLTKYKELVNKMVSEDLDKEFNENR